MDPVHSFRLREPWDFQLEEGAVCWSRGFHLPTGLETQDQLWLAIGGLPDQAEVAVNEQPVLPHRHSPQQQLAHYEVTALVTVSSRVTIRVPIAGEHPWEAGRFPFDVKLGIVEGSQ